MLLICRNMNEVRRVRGPLRNAFFGSGSTLDICLLDFPLISARSPKKKKKKKKKKQDVH